ncbi:MAG: hypothetical protein QM791_08720 [Ferruginibacter sp.]
MLLLLTGLLCSFSTLLHSDQPPQGHTGATGVYCTQCHSTNPLNSPGGSITATGLPGENYIAGTAYNFSLTINHSTATRKRWGFSIIALNSLGQKVGSFSSSNPNAAINGNELSHLDAVNFALTQQSFTYTDLKWTAPANPSEADRHITFYFTGNAANGNNGSSGDYIYASTIVTDLPVSQTYTFTGSGNWNDPANWSNNTIPPSTITGSSTTIIIDPPAGAECIMNVEQHITGGATLLIKEGKLFRVTGNLDIK